MLHGRLLVVVVVCARWNTYVSVDDDDFELYEQCFKLLIVCYGNVNTVYLCIRAFHVNNSCNLKFSSKHEEHIMFMILEMLDMYKVQCLQMVDLGFENMNKQLDKIGSHAVVEEVC